MKINKALKRLTKIESLMADVAKRISAHTPDLRGGFDEVKAAIGRVKEAIGAQASSRTGKKKAAPSKTAKAAEKATPGRTKVAAKKAAAKAPVAKSANKRAPVTRAAKRTARAPEKAASASAGHESVAPASEME